MIASYATRFYRNRHRAFQLRNIPHSKKLYALAIHRQKITMESIEERYCDGANPFVYLPCSRLEAICLVKRMIRAEHDEQRLGALLRLMDDIKNLDR